MPAPAVPADAGTFGEDILGHLATAIDATSGGVRDKGGQRFNVRAQYGGDGAVGDGTTDDTAAILRAIAATRTADSGILEFPPTAANVYKIKTEVASGLILSIATTDRLRFVSPPGVTLKLDPTSATGATMIRGAGTGFGVEGLTLDTSGVTNAVGITLQSATRPKIRDVHVIGGGVGAGGLAAFRINTNCFDVLIEACSSFGMTYGLFSNNSTTGDRWWLLNNTFDGDGVAGNGFNMNTTTGTRRGIWIIGNACRNFTGTSSGGTGIAVASMQDLFILRNYIEECDLDGIHLEDGFIDAVVADNIVRNCGQIAYRIISGSPGSVSDRITVARNRAYDCATTAGSGVFSFGGATRVNGLEAYLNTVYGGGREGENVPGFRVFATDSEVYDNRVRNLLGTGLEVDLTTSTSTRLRHVGSGAPESVIPAGVGSQWIRRDGGAATTMYIKQSGDGNTGWASVT